MNALRRGWPVLGPVTVTLGTGLAHASHPRIRRHSAHQRLARGSKAPTRMSVVGDTVYAETIGTCSCTLTGTPRWGVSGGDAESAATPSSTLR
jgi:hypothetical protein